MSGRTWVPLCPIGDCDWEGKAHASADDAWKELCGHLGEHPELLREGNSTAA